MSCDFVSELILYLFIAAAYKSPIFTIYNESDQLHYTLKSYYTDLYGSSFLGKVAPVVRTTSLLFEVLLSTDMPFCWPIKCDTAKSV